MNNVKFRKIESIKEYLTVGLESGKFESKIYQKSGEITARKGKIGEKIVTIMNNGLEETQNTVIANENGCPGWVVTNSTGEQYIVADSVFRNKYEKVDDTEDKYKPVWNPVTAAQVNENICFTAPWGEEQKLVAGGYLIFSKNFDDIYGVQKDEFIKTYDFVALKQE